MFKNIQKMGAVVALYVLSAGANAAVIEYSSSFASNNLSNYSATTGYSLGDASVESSSITLDRFDSSLGTLTDVQISFTSTWDHYSYASAYDSYTESRRHTYSYSCGFAGWSTCYGSYYTYSNDTAVNVNASASFTVSLDDPFQSTSVVYDNNQTSCSRYSSGGTVSCVSEDSDKSNEFSGSLDLSAFDLSDFIGIDALDLSFENAASLSGWCDNSDNGDTCYAYNDALWSGNVSVTYTYDIIAHAVSEPASLAIFALGLVGLGASRRRQR